MLLGLCVPVVDDEQVLEAVAADPALASRHRIVMVTGSVWWAQSGRVAAPREQLDVPLVSKPFTVLQVLNAVEAAAARMA